MAEVFQMVATDKNHPAFEPGLINGDYHAAISGDSIRTICGIQLDGEDGVAAGPTKEGPVTCGICYSIIEEIKSIRNWK